MNFNECPEPREDALEDQLISASVKAVRNIPSHAAVLVTFTMAGCVPDSPLVTDPSDKNYFICTWHLSPDT